MNRFVRLHRLFICIALCACAALAGAEEKGASPAQPRLSEPGVEDSFPLAIPVSVPPLKAQPRFAKALPRVPDEKDKKPSVVYPPDEGILHELDECVEISNMNNLNLKLSRLNDRESDYAVRVAWSQFFPTFNESILNSNQQGVGGLLPHADGSVLIHSDVSQQSPWGTKLDFAFDETRTNWNNVNRVVSTSVSQPLWKGAGTDANLTKMRTARINRLISRGQMELDTQSLIFQVRTAYTNVIQQIQQRDVFRESVKSAQKFLEYAEARLDAGVETRLSVAQAKLQLRTRELSLVSNGRQLESAYDVLKQILDVDLEEAIQVRATKVDFGDIAPEELPPVETEADFLEVDESKGIVYLVKRGIKDGKVGDVIGTPKIIFQAQHFDEKKVLEEAMANRIDLLNNRRDLAVQQLQTMLAKNGLGMQVDLVGTYGHSYTSKDLRAAGTSSDVNNYTVGVNASIPWGKIADKAAYETALLELQKAEINLKKVRTTVHSDVRDIMRLLREAESTLLIQALVVEQAKQTVKATFIAFQNSIGTSFEVVSVKNDLITAESGYISILLNYVVDLARLEQVIGKPTGRIDLEGRTLGGEIEAHLPDSLTKKPTLRNAPDAEPNCDDHALNNSRGYRFDPKPEPDTRMTLVPVRKPPNAIARSSIPSH